jgi:hypothetical protein
MVNMTKDPAAADVGIPGVCADAQERGRTPS